MRFSSTLLLASLAVAAVVADDHDHDHDHDDHDDHELEECACVFEHRNDGTSITCDSQTIQTAFDALTAANCATDCDSMACEELYQVVQSAHDYCHHDELPVAIETGFHQFEAECEQHDCLIKRKYDADLPACQTYECDDAAVATAALAVLNDNNCATACATETVCADAYRTIRYLHDSCDHDSITLEVEEGIHDFEGPCESVGCNVATADYDPNECDHSDHDHDHDSAASFSVSAVALAAAVIATLL